MRMVCAKELRDDAETLIAALRKNGIKVYAGALISLLDTGEWQVVITTPLVKEDQGYRETYRRIQEILKEQPSPLIIRLQDVRVIEPESYDCRKRSRIEGSCVPVGQALDQADLSAC